jgi:hypothetical protein
MDEFIEFKEEFIELKTDGFYVEIEDVINSLRSFENKYLNPRIKAIILTKLEEAQLWSLKLMEDKPYVEKNPMRK